jgi:hypothetical protein
MNCQFTPKSTSGFARMIAGSGSAHGRKIDLFTASGKGLRFRLANKQIFFLAASVGKVSNPGETSDHWLDTTVGSIQKGKTYNLTIVYNFTGKSVQLKMDGKIIADATFKVQKMPSPLGKITFPEASGKVKVTLK